EYYCSLYMGSGIVLF
nr:immunoglobulin light chain junction region [Macaca mulatta]MOX11473.1 immunoglobulin light chain junction region [Macaca mulatta]MOX11503.1 immunoglobulin light chain junction region [Macaca mulatta]MOX11876.1 immunoglobulin light chain junction region [Macaca mulatta]MOX12114.1 immunoglobulin light chain junction region [Macaca mulatta]